jgi:hypothetical protein
MFAKSRIPKLIGLKKKDINSIGTIKKLNKTETPEGKKDEKNLNLLCLILIICIPIKIKALIVKVTKI